MPFADLYFSKQKGFIPCPVGSPSGQLRFIVVIPACREPNLISALDSLNHCSRPAAHVEVIVVLNLPENADQAMYNASRKTATETTDWMKANSSPGFRFILIEDLRMPVKDAGVGLARRTGMDQALYRFNLLDNSGGFILSFDADSICENNYFTAIEATLQKYPRTKGISIYFEHPVGGTDYPEPVYRGIVSYEMHLRYLNLMTRTTGFPYAFHTVGSCFGVRADTYAREGGMNRKKAGEDFYFLHKIIPLGEFREINDTCVIPSPRESDRVPFGTGAAIRKYVAAEKKFLLTYAPECFRDLHSLFRRVPDLYGQSNDETAALIKELDKPLKNFLHELNATDSIPEIRSNSGSLPTFISRFYRWFDAFRIIKFLNYAAAFYPQIPVRAATLVYLRNNGYPMLEECTADLELLNILRHLERKRQ